MNSVRNSKIVPHCTMNSPAASSGALAQQSLQLRRSAFRTTPHSLHLELLFRRMTTSVSRLESSICLLHLRLEHVLTPTSRTASATLQSSTRRSSYRVKAPASIARCMPATAATQAESGSLSSHCPHRCCLTNGCFADNCRQRLRLPFRTLRSSASCCCR